MHTPRRRRPGAHSRCGFATARSGWSV